MNRRQKSWKVVVVMVVLVLLILGAFLWLRGRENKEKGKESMTEVEKLLAHDLETNYPGNAREVIRFYNRLMKCFYNEELTEEELKGLADQARILFDVELLRRNPLDQYVENLKTEILLYKELQRTIINVELQDYDEVRFETKGEDEIASLLSYYLIKEGTGSDSTYLRYYLREDEDGKWRILFWELSEEKFE